VPHARTHLLSLTGFQGNERHPPGAAISVQEHEDIVHRPESLFEQAFERLSGGGKRQVADPELLLAWRGGWGGSGRCCGSCCGGRGKCPEALGSCGCE
jgi:hypothetical protein